MAKRQMIARELTDKEHTKMCRCASDILDLLKDHFKDDDVLKLFTVKHINTVFNEGMGCDAMLTANSSHAVDLRKVERVRDIITGLTGSSVNIALFRNVPSLWMQLSMADFLSIPTYILAEDVDRETLAEGIRVTKIRVNKIMWLDTFDDSDKLKEATEILIKQANKELDSND